MGTRKGNTKYIETPEKMWELFEAYAKDVKENPRKKHTFVGKDGVSEYELLERPLTMEGFEMFVADIPSMPMDLSDYFGNKDGRYSDYTAICTRIRKAIRRDQIEGGMVGQYNTSITQRLNNLAEKTQLDLKAEPRVFKID